jgi:hypothetical protein
MLFAMWAGSNSEGQLGIQNIALTSQSLPIKVIRLQHLQHPSLTCNTCNTPALLASVSVLASLQHPSLTCISLSLSQPVPISVESNARRLASLCLSS